MNTAELNARAAQLSEQAAHLYSRARRRNETLQAAKAQAVAATGEASSSDGAVRATVDAGGMLTGLVLGPAVSELNPRQLAALVVQVTQQAAASARAAVRSVYTPLQDEGVVREAPVLLPEVAPAPVQAPPVRRRPEVSDDDFGGPVMKEQGW
ncbi:hypothetical protein Lesp02_33340 [Lentzea sp. NBRC 105346]|uniref:YbaB/EbfC family nucleoid-associated protein n=1 Tax=Lentzea sp. NBRC 105346 TaxID=3032205 RepID=UPI0024A0A4A0|nr:YbaB/EbfC family nucleoid-associated protein [Lentzea sp. NBRC 105346]GLZ31146.1 hypothetical protein Lesp02_33340 [Lentzea sp. NBRC 105346]